MDKESKHVLFLLLVKCYLQCESKAWKKSIQVCKSDSCSETKVCNSFWIERKNLIITCQNLLNV